MTDTDPPPTLPAPIASLGLRALEVARVELAANVHEHPPGSNRGPRVDVYQRGVVRGGKTWNAYSLPWCACFASWCVWQAIGCPSPDDGSRETAEDLHTEACAWSAWEHQDDPAKMPPIGRRAAVSELVVDARATGAWRPVGEYRPQAGDLAIWRRNGQDPALGGSGHVEIVELPPDEHGTWTGIGGNEGDGVRRETHTESHDLVGWIAL